MDKERLKQVLEHVRISEDEFREVRNIIYGVRDRILTHIDELKEKG